MPIPSNVSELGRRTVVYEDVVPIQDPASGLRTLQRRRLTREEFSSHLTAEEAQELASCEWRPTNPDLVQKGHPPFMTTCQGRRFFADADPSKGYQGPKTVETPAPPPPAQRPDFDLPGKINPKYQKLLIKAGWTTAASVLEAGKEKLMAINGIASVSAEQIIDACSDHLANKGNL